MSDNTPKPNANVELTPEAKMQVLIERTVQRAEALMRTMIREAARNGLPVIGANPKKIGNDIRNQLNTMRKEFKDKGLSDDNFRDLILRSCNGLFKELENDPQARKDFLRKTMGGNKAPNNPPTPVPVPNNEQQNSISPTEYGGYEGALPTLPKGNRPVIR